MKTKLASILAAALAFTLAATAPSVRAVEVAPGFLADRGASAALASLPADPADAAANVVFTRATLEFLAAVESLGRDFYSMGLQFDAGRSLPVPFLRMRIPVHPDPRPATAADVRRALDAFHARLAAIDARLAPIEGREFTVIFPLGAAGFDFVGADNPADRVAFGPFFAGIANNARAAAGDPAADPARAGDLVVAFDQTDALWLRAYTHLLRGLADVLLAHDGGELFDATGHLYFARADTAFARALAAHPGETSRRGYDSGQIADLIATIHGIDLVVSEPARLARARVELLEMIRLSRVTLASAAAETDDDREWLPGPAQNSVFNLRLSAEQTAAWSGVLAEIEALLTGEKLLPHWRFPAGNFGLNLRRVFEESRHTDLIGLVQGAAAVPYLESGPTTSQATWRELTRVFGGNFLGYALWIN
jgi:hypothetical protein